MSFELTEDQELIRKSVAELAGKFDDHYWMEKDQAHEFPQEFYDAISKGGWLGMTIPEEYGGHGLGITEATLLLEEVARSGAAMNGASAIHLSIFGMQPVVKHGSDELKKATLPRIVNGDLHVCFGVTEPGAGLDTTHITTFARRDGDHYVVNGRKVWISKALESEKILLLTRTQRYDEVTKKTDGMTLFLTDLDRDHVDIRPIRKMGRNAVSSNELFIDDLMVPVGDRVGEEGKGFKYILDGLNPERMLIAAEALGIGRVALEKAVKYGNERVVFNRPIGMNQGLQFPLADSLRRRDGAELVRGKGTGRSATGKRCGREANTAKYLCADAGFGAADPGTAVARRHGLLRGVPRVALLPRIASDEDRAGQPGDDPELPGRARPRSAEELLMANSYLDLTGRSALVTGAAGGIGSAGAVALADAGAAVLVTDLEKDAAAAVAERISDAGGRAESAALDVSDRDSADAAAAQAAPLADGALHIVINNAGVTKPAMFDKTTQESFRLLFDIHVMGAFNVTQAALPYIPTDGTGRIVNVTSAAGLTGTLGQVNYSAAKAGIIGFTKSLARELATKNIMVNALAPLAATPMTETIRTNEKFSANMMNRIPMKRWAEPSEIAGAFVFMASNAASYITGQVLPVDGGMVI